MNKYMLSSLALSAAFSVQALAAPVLYTNDFEEIIGEQFTKDTGYELDVVKMSGGNLIARIAAERSNPQWDLILFNGDNTLHSLSMTGDLKENLNPANAANLTEEAQALVPSNHAFYPVGISSACVIVQRKGNNVDVNSYQDITKPELKGVVGMADPSIAAPTYPCVAGLFHELGEKEAKALFSDAFDNGMRIFRTNGPTGRALQSGEIEVALLTSQQAYTFVDQGADFDIIWPETGTPATVRAFGVQANTAHSEATEAFANWMLSEKGQQFLADNGGSDGVFRPTITQATEVPFGPGMDVKYNFTPVKFAYENDEAIKSWFADNAIN
ncbi:extracellular solute-binding protein [Photobacterium sp. ZSDE20]|uniref:Extracellular solute-binding protein n=1 Tax=Photobacterium pectinilyticum TaxID=2906793 RepID=A0ABT1N4E6_9GAMM|nr:extracellular solute-binding protein [Photobacterium sp. ZSDE20]MCQ1059608.1 extracellular solute-binding protein [Photobacterium sp. ZSDE20]MDD1828957.1 extracellular solute-binding protein [Photobacterium sp. ZSDE20]